MQLTRQEKEDLVDELATRMDEHPVVGVLDMHSLPARQLQEIKKELVGDATIKMTRKTLIHLALEKSDKDDITDLKENPAIQPALIFTEQNPFSLYKTIQDKKTSAAASGGEIAPNDIVVEAGMTELDPGPMLGRIQELGAQTSVEDGKIKIENDAVAVEEGEVIDNNTAEILNNLGMEPLEVGLDLKLVYQDGEVFDKDVLAIDAEDYRQDIEAAASRGFNLAVNAGYITEQTVVPMLQERVSKARNLAVNAGVINEETIEPLLSKAAGHGAGLDASVDLDAVDLDEYEEAGAEEPDEDTDDEAADDTEATDGDADDAEEPDEDTDVDDSDEEPDEDVDEADEESGDEGDSDAADADDEESGADEQDADDDEEQ